MIRPFRAVAAVPVLGAALLLSACNRPAEPPRNAPPMSSAPGASSQMPQPANSLPPGDRVNAPVQGSTGNVGTTRVAPAR